MVELLISSTAARAVQTLRALRSRLAESGVPGPLAGIEIPLAFLEFFVARTALVAFAEGLDGVAHGIRHAPRERLVLIIPVIITGAGLLALDVAGLLVESVESAVYVIVTLQM
jgi:hypothetical protein